MSSLHICSDVADSTIAKNQVTDLLREVNCQREGRGTMFFEPLHIQYTSLRNKFKMQVAETTGELVTFGEGNTIATLHFKKT